MIGSIRKIVSSKGKVLGNESLELFGKIWLCHLSRTHISLKHSGVRDDLGQTTIILQDGLDIQELPSIVRKVKDVGLISLRNFNSSNKCDNGVNNNLNDKKPVDKTKKTEDSAELSSMDIDDALAEELVDIFGRCYTAKGVFTLLETIPEEEVSPNIAFQALRRIIELENNEQFRNIALRNHENIPENFTRMAVFNQLIDIITNGPKSEPVIETLRIVSREIIGGHSTQYRDKLCDEILMRVTDGKFTIGQFCEVVKLLSSFQHDKKMTNNVDKLWVGLVDRELEIDEINIVDVFQILPFLKQSRKMAFNILEKRLSGLWWRLSGKKVADILAILFEVRISSPRTLSILSRWMNTNIHTVSEGSLIEIVLGFSHLSYVDEGIEKALERFVKAKGSKIKNPAVFAGIIDYCAKFRIRSNPILEGCSEYIIQHGHDLTPTLLKTMFLPFGFFNFHPSNATKFWQAVEDAVDKKFVQLHPEDVLDLLLGCVYLGKHPLNFVGKVFNPYFLDRMHTCQDGNMLQLMRAKLKLFDTAMTLECPQYHGPMLPKDLSAKSLWQDGRIRRTINHIMEPLAEIMGDTDRISTTIVLPQLPTIDLYVVDVVLHPSGMGGSTLQHNLRQDRDLYVAILIHIPEHFCSQGEHLIGPQVMRKKHLQLMGFKVVELCYNTLSKLRVHPVGLQEYLVERLQLAQHAL